MYLTPWDGSLVLGVEPMDADHERLVKLLNDCYRALMLNDHSHELAAIVTELRDYAMYHFDAERTLMVEASYPETGRHLQEHATFVGAVDDFRRRFIEGECFIALDVLTFLKEWLVSHIMKSDRSLALFLETPAST